MSWLARTAIASITSFAATNIDDIAILMLFFAQLNTTFRPKHIVIGQYLGFIALILISLPGFFGGLILPQYWIGLLGLIPITIGLSNLLNQEEDASEEVEAETELYQDSAIANFLSPQAYAVAAVTFANGGDNIGVYVPLFANSNLGSLVVIICIFLLLVGVWCYVAYKLTQQLAITDILTRYLNYLVPVVLIGLGAFIVLESGALSLLKLVASCLCLMILVKKDSSISN
ncbi:MAG: cadmium resistance transporter [Tolypothrix sp. T3-bin4]|nr:cadmium resistance transporter [Tolypothrix sp. T3-bin4]